MSRELDIAIAEALGYEVRWEFEERKSYTGHVSDLMCVYKVKQFDGGGYLWYDLPSYSTDGSAMLELDREMRVRGWWLFVERVEINPYKFCAFYRHPEDSYQSVQAYAKNEILARALAAYKALTGEEWKMENNVKSNYQKS